MKSGKKTRVDDAIAVAKVRLIDAEGEQRGIVSISEALDVAKAAGLNLVEVSPQAEPPVCRVMDYGKHLYQSKQNKRGKGQKSAARPASNKLKKIQLRPVTDRGDIEIKQRRAMGFLEQGNRVKVCVRFRGREMAHQNIGLDVLNRFVEGLSEVGVVEVEPKMEGREMGTVVVPLRAAKGSGKTEPGKDSSEK